MAEPAFFGTILRRGSSGPDVALVQRWLNSAHDRYPAINTVSVDGRYGAATVSAVRMLVGSNLNVMVWCPAGMLRARST